MLGLRSLISKTTCRFTSKEGTLTGLFLVFASTSLLMGNAWNANLLIKNSVLFCYESIRFHSVDSCKVALYHVKLWYYQGKVFEKIKGSEFKKTIILCHFSKICMQWMQYLYILIRIQRKMCIKGLLRYVKSGQSEYFTGKSMSNILAIPTCAVQW